MNCSEAKKISIIGYLASQGIKPDTIKNDAVWFRSPFRNEEKPSFKVSRSANIWFDFGTGKGGNIIDLVCKIHNIGIPGALLQLQKPELVKHNFSFSQQPKEKQSNIKMKHIQAIYNKALIQYLAERKISIVTASKFLNEAYYEVNGKQYFALVFKNDLGGYELRNKYFKGSYSPKAITTIQGSQNDVNVYEGFIDFLSSMEYYKIQKPINTSIILNSLSNLSDNVSKILYKYSKINLYLDNDPAGRSATRKILNEFQNATNYAEFIYPDYKDFNELLTLKN